MVLIFKKKLKVGYLFMSKKAVFDFCMIDLSTGDDKLDVLRY